MAVQGWARLGIIARPQLGKSLLFCSLINLQMFFMHENLFLRSASEINLELHRPSMCVISAGAVLLRTFISEPFHFFALRTVKRI